MRFLKYDCLENSSSAPQLTLQLMTKFSHLGKASHCDPLRGAQVAPPGSCASVRCWSVERWPNLLPLLFVPWSYAELWVVSTPQPHLCGLFHLFQSPGYHYWADLVMHIGTCSKASLQCHWRNISPNHNNSQANKILHLQHFSYLP